MTQRQLNTIIKKHEKWLNLESSLGEPADLSGKDLYGLDLRRVDLRCANLLGANLQETNLYGADLDKADLSQADLTCANLYGVNLEFANLHKTNLYGAILLGANLYEANLKEANLSDAELEKTNLFRADLTGTISDGTSHEIAGELLIRKSYNNVEKRKLAGLVLVSTDWCIGEFRKIFKTLTPDLQTWVLDTLLEEENWGFGWLKK